MASSFNQDKLAETAFFAGHAQADEYNVFTESSTKKLFELCRQLADFKPCASVVDIGCGSGVFTQFLRDSGIKSIGLDLSNPLLLVGQRKYAGIRLVAGDAEVLPFPTGNMDGVLLSGIIHHLPEPTKCAREVFRRMSCLQSARLDSGCGILGRERQAIHRLDHQAACKGWGQSQSTMPGSGTSMLRRLFH